MTDVTAPSNTVNDKLFLICGFPASGKTASLRNLKNVLYLNCENGKRPSFKPKGFLQKTVTDPEQLFEAFEKAEEFDDIDTIVIDGLNFLMDMYETQYVLTAKDTRSAWGEYSQYFKRLMQTYVAGSSKNVIFTAHTKAVYNETTYAMETQVPIKGALGNQGIEAYFSTIVYTKKMTIADLEAMNQNSELLHITDEERALGYKHVFQTKITKDTTHERMRGPMGLWDNNEIFIDNDANLVLQRLHEYYSE